MIGSKYNFQYCPKLVLFSNGWSEVLLAKRKNELDYDGTFSFIGGKLEITDASIRDGIQREKNEEIGEDVKLRLCLKISFPVLFRKKDGSSMIVPHHLAKYVSGKISLNKNEYSEFRWVKIEELDALEPKIENISDIVNWFLKLKEGLASQDFVEV